MATLIVTLGTSAGPILFMKLHGEQPREKQEGHGVPCPSCFCLRLREVADAISEAMMGSSVD